MAQTKQAQDPRLVARCQAYEDAVASERQAGKASFEKELSVAYAPYRPLFAFCLGLQHTPKIQVGKEI